MHTPNLMCMQARTQHTHSLSTLKPVFARLLAKQQLASASSVGTRSAQKLGCIRKSAASRLRKQSFLSALHW